MIVTSATVTARQTIRDLAVGAAIPALTQLPIPPFDPAPIQRVRLRTRGVIRTTIPVLARQPIPPFRTATINNTFSLHPGHMFVALQPDWGWRLTETQATRGLAHLVMQRDKEMRIQALLAGLGIAVESGELSDAEVVAEEGRIDLLIRWAANTRAVVVEAKFAHRVTKGQLSKYRQQSQKTVPPKGTRYVLLLLDPEENVLLRGPQRASWTIRTWAACMMTMERCLRKPGAKDDDNFRQFRRMLWERIGGLQQRKH